MKKIYSALVAFLLIASIPAIAQKGLYFGVAGTASSTWITNQNNYGLPEMDYISTVGIGGNINVGYDFTNSLGVKLEIGLATMGQKYKDKQGDSTFNREVKLKYLTIPVLFKYRTGGSIAKFYIAIGPQFNMLMTGKQTYTLNDKPFVDTLKTVSGKRFQVGLDDVKERFSSSDIFARMDLGVEITVVKHLMIDLGLTLGYGLMDMNATDYRLPDHSGKYHPSHDVFGGVNLGVNWRL